MRSLKVSRVFGSWMGRARLVCFSFGGEDAPAPQTPLTLATIELRGVSAGSVTLRFENVAIFTPDAEAVTVATTPATIRVE